MCPERTFVSTCTILGAVCVLYLKELPFSNLALSTNKKPTRTKQNKQTAFVQQVEEIELQTSNRGDCFQMLG